jgi:hypothetical protein
MSNERWIRSKITVEGKGMTHWYECRFRGPWGEFSMPVNGDEHADAFLLLLNNGEAYPALVEAMRGALGGIAEATEGVFRMRCPNDGYTRQKADSARCSCDER